jgi:hypothetical protein
MVKVRGRMSNESGGVGGGGQYIMGTQRGAQKQQPLRTERTSSDQEMKRRLVLS